MEKIIHKKLKKDIVALDDRVARELLEEFNKKELSQKDKSGFIKILN